MEEIKKFLAENKKVKLIVATLLIIIVLLILFFTNCTSKEDLKVTYSKGEEFAYTKFTKKFDDKRTITIENKTDKQVTYDLRWYNVQNTLTKQDKFVYEITCKGEACQTIGESQMPGSAYPIFINIVIGPKKKHVYTVSLKYKGSEKKVKFTGILKPLVVK